MNKVFLIGRLGDNPSQTGKVATFSLATSRPKRRDGETVRDQETGYAQMDTEWHKITCFNGKADLAMKYLKKGEAIAVHGHIHYSSYEKEGAKRYQTEIIVDDFEFLP